MLRLVKALLLVALATATLALASTAGSQGASQLVISGQTPPGATTGNLNGFGVWVWCEDQAAGNPYAGACAGSMYFYNIGLTKSVRGTVVLTSGSFTVELGSRDGTVDCTVSGSLPATKGPSNTINVNCSTPARSGTLSNVVVRVT